jgi:hypothetical protein
MHPAISLFLARARITDLHEQARRDVRARSFRGHDPDTVPAARRWLY